MKKTLLATALVAGLAGVAHAENSVTLYGIIDGGYGYDQRTTKFTSDKRAYLGSFDPQQGIAITPRNQIAMEQGAGIGWSEGKWQNGNYYPGQPGIYGPSEDFKYRDQHIGFQSGIANHSRWGLKGKEDLGNGTSAIFKLEAGFDLGNGRSTQDGRLFGREAYVGLSGEDWGTFTLGRQYNTGDAFLKPIDPFHTDFGLASAKSTFGDVLSGRFDAVAKYVSPNFNGFQFGVGVTVDANRHKEDGLRSTLNADQMYGYEENTPAYAVANGFPATYPVAYGDTYRKHDETYGVTSGLSYTYGPLYLAAGYDFLWHRTKEEGFNGVRNLPETKDKTTGHIWTVGGTYDFDVVKLHLMYGQQYDGSYDTLMGGEDGMFNPLAIDGRFTDDGNPLRTTGKGYRSQSWLAGLSAPVSEQGTLMFSYQGNTQKNKEDEFNLSKDDEVKSTGHVFSLGYQHQLSKRTSVYAVGSYGWAKDKYHDANETERKINAVFGAIGMQHRF